MDNNQNFEEENSAADDIAAEITKILVKAFTTKEGRAPTGEEVEQLIEELTEERIESMLGGLGAEDEDVGEDDADEIENAVDSEHGEESGDDKADDADSSPLSAAGALSNGAKRPIDENIQDSVTKDEHGDPNERKKLKTSEEKEADATSL